ncbi:hypothetical protein FKW77_009114 [Venturia effusa]|uniref:Uncharacterized protein n=1 Tax=Venturia effusa TaxID=50376 RepID=A0A517LEH8_9PEZI|nr:hypothetical protein FKW77_009114 [Venturia effusa]
MKLHLLAAILLASPFNHVLGTPIDHDGKDMLNSDLNSPNPDSRSAFATGTGLSSSTDIVSRSTSSANICIDYCTTPDSVQEGICVKNQCWPARQCIKIQGLVTEEGTIHDAMANIKMPAGVFCGIWTTLDCTKNGRKSEYEAHGNVDDISKKMKALAKSYRCYYEGQNKRAVKELENEVAIEPATPEITAVETKALSSNISKRVPCINIQWSSSPDNVQEGTNYEQCVVPLLCYNINQPFPGGMATVHFENGYACDVYSQRNCLTLSKKSHARITRSTGDFTGLLQESVNDGRAHSFSCEGNAPHITKVKKSAVETPKAGHKELPLSAVVKSTKANETSHAGPTICVDFCTTPDSVLDDDCYFSICTPPGMCMNVNRPLPGSMGSIHFGDDINCDIYRAFDCKVDGRNSHAQIRRGVSDCTGMVQGLAHSYKCEWASDRKRAIEMSEEGTASVEAQFTSLKARSESTTPLLKLDSTHLGTCVHYCDGPNFSGNCVRNHCTRSQQCTNVPATFGNPELVSLAFGNSTQCELYIVEDCVDDSSYPQATAEKTTGNVMLLPWSVVPGKMSGQPVKSFKCKKVNKRGIEARGAEAKIVTTKEPTSITKRDDLTTQTELGTCVDHCSDRDFKGKCTRNHCTASKQCVVVDEGINSIAFEGATICAIFTSKNCKQLGGNGKVVVKATTKWVEAFAHWGTTGHSFQCMRSE